jgi:hypothetical protein
VSDQTSTSDTCPTIKIETVAIMTAINRGDGRDVSDALA